MSSDATPNTNADETDLSTWPIVRARAADRRSNSPVLVSTDGVWLRIAWSVPEAAPSAIRSAKRRMALRRRRLAMIASATISTILSGLARRKSAVRARNSLPLVASSTCWQTHEGSVPHVSSRSCWSSNWSGSMNLHAYHVFVGHHARVRFDLNDPAVIADPYPHYARLREQAPVHRTTDPALWMVSRHDDVVAVLRDPVRFSSDLGAMAKGLGGNPFDPSSRLPGWAAGLVGHVPWLRVLLTSDPPEHTTLRRKVSRAFTPRMMAAWEERIRAIAETLIDDLIDDLIAGGPSTVDLVRTVASPLPTAVIAEMMGIPADRRDDFKRWSDDLIDGLLTGGNKVRMLRSASAISVFFARTVRQRRRHAGDDLISLLVTGDEQDRLNLAELIAFCVLLLVAGNETTTNLISNAMVALFDRPDLWAQVTADPTLATAVVEETLRYDGPAQGLLRVSTTDVVLGGVTIPAGQAVMPLVASANRDPRHWDDPDTFRLDRRLDRTSDDHLAFGTGIHYCIGQALARLEGSVAIEAILRRVPQLQPAGTPERIGSPVLRGLRTLPVALAVPSA